MPSPAGHLWANRFCSTPLYPLHLWTAIRYIERNPVRAGLARRATDWPWSRALVHAAGRPNPPLAADDPFGGRRPHPMHGRPLSWGAWLALRENEQALDPLRAATLTGRPCGATQFVQGLEMLLGRSLTPPQRRRKPRDPAAVDSGQPDFLGLPGREWGKR